MENAIGVIDSGVGGLTVAHELMRQLPKERLIYLGDTLRCPYGSRSEDEVRQFTWEMVDFLLQKEIKLLVIACNTATAFTLEELQKELEIPVIGVIQPGARAAINYTHNNNVAVIGTEGTIRSNAYEETLKTINSEINVFSLACPLFVPLVESRSVYEYKFKEIIQKSLAPLKMEQNIDTLILGCTHYPIIKDAIQEAIGDKVSIVSSSEETARETSVVLDLHQILNHKPYKSNHQFFTTGKIEIFTSITKAIFKSSIKNLKTVTIEKAVIR
ncbi:glutamate racemase [Salipaludibacillus agaradhaerens]|uniref:glutamate racemase n=1 Tax=Salipaludibacillus agaradhaerens TaxID=76935 RepID=UPI002150E467|nr:glutamate racemase [Salipaludibacillus agaradhaerens]MCR6108167.1 glutamate racemase [Salipaludibacillus agaradhaerens]MCR6120192.1 glutamate racemase [Salipaludibacillus agaradhaerens]